MLTNGTFRDQGYPWSGPVWEILFVPLLFTGNQKTLSFPKEIAYVLTAQTQILNIKYSILYTQMVWCK